VWFDVALEMGCLGLFGKVTLLWYVVNAIWSKELFAGKWQDLRLV
jgi:hypothetical protein